MDFLQNKYYKSWLTIIVCTIQLHGEMRHCKTLASPFT